MTQLSHDEFKTAYKLDRVQMLYNVEKAAEVLCEAVNDKAIQGAMKKFLLFKRSAKWVYGVAAITLFTPVRWLATVAVLLWAVNHLLEKGARKYIDAQMQKDGDFYARMLKENVVALAVSPEVPDSTA